MRQLGCAIGKIIKALQYTRRRNCTNIKSRAQAFSETFSSFSSKSGRCLGDCLSLTNPPTGPKHKAAHRSAVRALARHTPPRVVVDAPEYAIRTRPGEVNDEHHREGSGEWPDREAGHAVSMSRRSVAVLTHGGLGSSADRHRRSAACPRAHDIMQHQIQDVERIQEYRYCNFVCNPSKSGSPGVVEINKKWSEESEGGEEEHVELAEMDDRWSIVGPSTTSTTPGSQKKMMMEEASNSITEAEQPRRLQPCRLLLILYHLAFPHRLSPHVPFPPRPMAQNGISRQTKIALTISLAMLVFFLELPSHAASWAQADAERKLLEGFTALNVLGALYCLSSLALDAHRWIMGIRDRLCNRRSPSPSLAELECGQGQALKGKATSATEPPPRSSEPPTTRLSWRVALLSVFERLTLLVFHAVSLLGVLFHGKVVSLQEPLIDNIAAALLFVLWGLQVLFVALLLVLLIAWLVGAASLSTAEGEAERACRKAVGVRSEPSFDVEKVSESSGKGLEAGRKEVVTEAEEEARCNDSETEKVYNDM